MTREEFNKLYLDKVVHCDTEEKANHFLALGDSVGYRWNSRKSLIERNEWERFKKETCYEVTKYGFMFSDKKNFELDGYQIIEYEPQPKFKVGDKVKVKSISYPYLNEKVGVIESVDLLSPISYAAKVGRDGWTAWFYENQLEKVEESKFKVGDKVRVKDTIYTKLNGKVGVVESVDSLSIMPYTVKITDDYSSGFWFFYENQLEKVEEPTYKEETINNIIKEIKEYQERITVLLNRLEQEIENR